MLSKPDGKQKPLAGIREVHGSIHVTECKLLLLESFEQLRSQHHVPSARMPYDTTCAWTIAKFHRLPSLGDIAWKHGAVTWIKMREPFLP